MTRDEIRAVALGVLKEIAPEADLAGLDPQASIREQIDLDSMDVLSVMVGLHRALGVEIPESDYGKLTTLADCVEYLAARVAEPRATP